jgi:hypothetical protein
MSLLLAVLETNFAKEPEPESYKVSPHFITEHIIYLCCKTSYLNEEVSSLSLQQVFPDLSHA